MPFIPDPGTGSERSPTGDAAPRVLVIPGLNGHPDLLMRTAPELFPGWQAMPFNHHADVAADGVDGLARRALRVLGEDQTPAWVCGESFGGTVALTLAHRNPERVKGLILLSAFGWHPSSLARRGQGALAVWSFLGHRIGNSVYTAGRVASLPTQLGLRFPREMFDSYLNRPRAHVPAYRAKAALSLTFDARPWLGSIACPAFVLVGSWDPVVPTAAGRDLARRLPRARLYRLPGGHLVHLVRAKQAGALISAWAKDLP